MKEISTSDLDRISRFLVSEGWIEDPRVVPSARLFSHPEHPRRQLMLPTDVQAFSDAAEVVDRAISKLAEMTDRGVEDIHAAIAEQPARDGRRRTALSAILVAVIVLAGAAHMRQLWVPEAPPSMAEAGCMDLAAAGIVRTISADAAPHSGDDSEEALRRDTFGWRALKAADYARDMRRCYLEARSRAPGFDRARLIDADMDLIEASMRGTYASLSSAFVPAGRAKTASLLQASEAAERISYRLADQAERWYLP